MLAERVVLHTGEAHERTVGRRGGVAQHPRRGTCASGRGRSGQAGDPSREYWAGCRCAGTQCPRRLLSQILLGSCHTPGAGPMVRRHSPDPFQEKPVRFLIGKTTVFTRISDLAVALYPSNQSSRPDFRGSVRKYPTRQGGTLWVRKKPRHFRSPSNGCLKVAFQGSRVTSDTDLILVRALDERLGLEAIITEHLRDSRQGLHTHATTRGSRGRDRDGASGLSRLARHVLRGHAQGCGADLSADLRGYLLEVGHGEAISGQDGNHGGGPAQRPSAAVLRGQGRGSVTDPHRPRDRVLRPTR